MHGFAGGSGSWQHRRQAALGRIASSIPPDLISGRDRLRGPETTDSFRSASWFKSKIEAISPIGRPTIRPRSAGHALHDVLQPKLRSISDAAGLGGRAQTNVWSLCYRKLLARRSVSEGGSFHWSASSTTLSLDTNRACRNGLCPQCMCSNGVIFAGYGFALGFFTTSNFSL
jgi:hypothetical protein